MSTQTSAISKRQRAKKTSWQAKKWAGFLNRNPVLSMGMGLSVLVAVSTTVKNAAAMSIMVFFMTTITYLFASIMPLGNAKHIRLPIYALVAAIAFIPGYLVNMRLFPDIRRSLGIYFFLLATDTLVMYRADRFARHNQVLGALSDAMLNWISFSVIMFFISAIREFLGFGSIWGIRLMRFQISGVTLPFFGFALVGMVAALFQYIAAKKKNPPIRKGPPARMKHKIREEEILEIREREEREKRLESGESPDMPQRKVKTRFVPAADKKDEEQILLSDQSYIFEEKIPPRSPDSPAPENSLDHEGKE